jgi:hypothetical protein
MRAKRNQARRALSMAPTAEDLGLPEISERKIMNPPTDPSEFTGPGMPRQYYINQLASAGYTGWYDQHGNPAPWPEDFTDPDSGWVPTESDDTGSDSDLPCMGHRNQAAARSGLWPDPIRPSRGVK